MDTSAGLRSARLSRRAWAGVLSFLLLASSLAGSYRLYHALDLETGPDQYNIADWELRSFPGKWLFLFGQVFRGQPSVEQQDQTLRRFFDLTRDINDLERHASNLEQRGQQPPGSDRESLASMVSARDGIENQVEATIEARLTTVAADAGLTRSFLNVVWPPIDFEFTQSPYTLVTSPRNRIELLDSSLLRDDLTLTEVEAIEAKAESGGRISALAFPTGGIGAYPTIVDYANDYRRALEVVAHEWTHNYLFFRPLGFNYYASNDLRTLNETVADLVGHELAAAAIARWPLEDATPQAARPPASTETPVDIGAELRSLRGEVDVLLAANRVEEAERLMEQRRQEFTAQGYFFRKLNQAYFAFVNLYAGESGEPAATNPIGPKVDELRRRSASLHEFVERISGVTTVAQLDRLLAEP